jgi:hypothetical protein
MCKLCSLQFITESPQPPLHHHPPAPMGCRNLHSSPTCQVWTQVSTAASLMRPWRQWGRLRGAAVAWAGRIAAGAGRAGRGGKAQKRVQDVLQSRGAGTGFVPQIRLLCLWLLWPYNTRARLWRRRPAATQRQRIKQIYNCSANKYISTWHCSISYVYCTSMER